MTEPLRPDAVYDPSGHPVAVRSIWMREAVLALPNLVKLLYRLIKDPRLSRKSKLVLGGILGYLVIPIDIVPDFVPIVGQVDDLLLIAYGIRHIIDEAGSDIVLEHWDGSQDVLAIVASVTGLAGNLLPKPVLRFLNRLGAKN